MQQCDDCKFHLVSAYNANDCRCGINQDLFHSKCCGNEELVDILCVYYEPHQIG